MSPYMCNGCQNAPYVLLLSSLHSVEGDGRGVARLLRASRARCFGKGVAEGGLIEGGEDTLNGSDAGVARESFRMA